MSLLFLGSWNRSISRIATVYTEVVSIPFSYFVKFDFSRNDLYRVSH